MEFLKSLFAKPLSYDEFVAAATGAGSPALPALFWRLLLLEHRTAFLVRQNRCRNPCAEPFANQCARC